MGKLLLSQEAAKKIVDVVHTVENNPVGQNLNPSINDEYAVTYAKITVNSGVGVYEAIEQVFDGSVFADKTGGRLWDGNPAPKLIESSFSESVAIDTIVKVEMTGTTAGDIAWFFTVGGGGGGGSTPIIVGSKVSDATQEYNCTIFETGYSIASTGSGLVRFPKVITGNSKTVTSGMRISGTKYGVEIYFTSWDVDTWQDG